MPRYSYPLTFQKRPAMVQRADPIAVLDAADNLVLYARERILKPGQIQVYRDEERSHELFKTNASYPRTGWQQEFVSVVKDRVVGALLEQRGKKLRTYSITDAKNKVLYTTEIEIWKFMKQTLKALMSGRLEDVPSVVFNHPGGVTAFELKSVDKKGSMRLHLHETDMSSGNEARMILSAIVLMTWWDDD